MIKLKKKKKVTGQTETSQHKTNLRSTISQFCIHNFDNPDSKTVGALSEKDSNIINNLQSF